MRFEEFKALREQIQRSAFSRQQLVDLFGEVAGRVCQMDEPELEAVSHDISDANESLKQALDEVEDREAKFAGPEPRDLDEFDGELDLARVKRACGTA